MKTLCFMIVVSWVGSFAQPLLEAAPSAQISETLDRLEDAYSSSSRNSYLFALGTAGVSVGLASYFFSRAETESDEQCRGGGECWAGFGAAMTGVGMLYLGLPITGAMLGSGIHRGIVAGDVRDLKTEVAALDSRGAEARLHSFVKDQRRFRLILGGVLAGSGLGLATFFALRTPLYRGNAFGTGLILGAPLLALSAWAFLIPSIAEDEWARYKGLAPTTSWQERPRYGISLSRSDFGEKFINFSMTF